jgi:hypothetical protein
LYYLRRFGSRQTIEGDLCAGLNLDFAAIEKGLGRLLRTHANALLVWLANELNVAT